MDYPPNSDASKTGPPGQEKNIKRVTSGDPVRRKKSLGRKFKDVFVAGDAKMALRDTLFDVLLPAAQEMIVETGKTSLERWIYGKTSRGRRVGSTPPQSGPTGTVRYNQMYTMGQQSVQRALSRQARARHDFDEIVLESRSEADAVIDQMYEILNKFDSVNVADLYELVGIRPTHVDGRWGWRDLSGSSVTRVREGYLLDLPEPVPLVGS